MAGKYKRDKNGRFASTGSASGGSSTKSSSASRRTSSSSSTAHSDRLSRGGKKASNPADYLPGESAFKRQRRLSKAGITNITAFTVKNGRF